MQPRKKKTALTNKDAALALESLSDNIRTNRVTNRMVDDKIAETVKGIRHLYDLKKRSRTKRGPLI